MQLKSSKSFHKLPCAHAQFQDATGPCKTFHGYDRSVTFEFTGDPDEYGWIVGFGELKPVRKFLEYYFDHTAVAPANDPRLADIQIAAAAGLFDLRVLPYGVSMEMSSLFIWEQVNPYIHHITEGRTYVSRVECREHDSNSACIEVTQKTAEMQVSMYHNFLVNKPKWGTVVTNGSLIEKPVWDYVSPRDAMNDYK